LSASTNEGKCDEEEQKDRFERLLFNPGRVPKKRGNRKKKVSTGRRQRGVYARAGPGAASKEGVKTKITEKVSRGGPKRKQGRKILMAGKIASRVQVHKRIGLVSAKKMRTCRRKKMEESGDPEKSKP